MADATTEMILRIKTDTTKAQADIGKVQSKISGIGAKVPQAAGQIKAGFSQMASTFAVATAAIGATVAVISDLITTAQEAEKGERKFETAMQQAGITSESAQAKWKDYATQIQKVTTLDDDAAMSIMQLALTMGASEENLDDITTGAIGLSEAFGIDVNSAVKMVTMGMNGQYTMLSRYIPELRSAKTESEKAAIFQKKLAEGFDLAKVAAGTSAGKMQQLSNHFGNLKEALGTLLLPVLDKAVTGLTSISTAMQGIIENISSMNLKEAGDGITDAIRGIAEYSTLGLSESVLGWVGLGKEAEKTEEKVKSTGETTKKTTKEIYRNGKIINEELSAMREMYEGAESAKDKAFAAGKIKILEKELDAYNGKLENTGKKSAESAKAKAKADKEAFDARNAQAKIDLFAINNESEEVKKLRSTWADFYAFAEAKDSPLKKMLAELNIEMVDVGMASEKFHKQIQDDFDKSARIGELASSVFKTSFEAIGQTAGGAEDALKSGLRGMLLSILDFLEAEYVAAGAAVALRALISGGFSLFADSAGFVVAAAGLAVARGVIGSFRTGIDYVPKDAMPAILHRGEKVLTAEEAERNRRGEAPAGSGRKQSMQKIHFTRFETAIQDVHINRSRRYA